MRIVRRSSATFVVALALLAAQASETLHQLVVRHETCPAHGEVIEGGGQADHGDALTARAWAARARLLAAAADELHAHDRCLAALGDGDRVTGGVAALVHDLPAIAARPAATATSEGRR